VARALDETVELGGTMNQVLPRFDFRLQVAGDTSTGPVRVDNQDALLLAPELACYGIADGMGGLAHGAAAAELALAAAREHLGSRHATRTLEAFVASPSLEQRRAVLELLKSACVSAHQRVREESQKRGEAMGTTLDLCVFVRDKAFVAHVGDGRVYLGRATTTLQITEDHLVHDPESLRLPRGGSRQTPRPLSSGIGLDAPLRVDVFPVDLRRGDLIVLASDGACAGIADETALHRVTRKDPAKVVHELVHLAPSRGGRDNATAIALRVEDRLVARAGDDAHVADDIATLSHCALFSGLGTPRLMAALASGIEVELEEGHALTASDAGDLCAYVVLEGMLELADGRRMGPPALIHAESLVGVRPKDLRAARVVERVRALRIRRDDFREVTAYDPQLAAALYERLAAHLARSP
jgi:PPM family protein phosphatase